MKNTMLVDKSKAFAIRAIKLYNYLKDSKQEFVISKQLLRSGTSVGANIAESRYAVSKLDFTNKLSIALKEANESEYWLELLYETGYIDKKEFDSIIIDIKELLKLLITSIKTARNIQPEQSDQ
ncbi:MAG: four helix bundle protein [Firmicutes bacterium]|nr:four helix bundle protein [Bacillota bacterium]